MLLRLLQCDASLYQDVRSASIRFALVGYQLRETQNPCPRLKS